MDLMRTMDVMRTLNTMATIGSDGRSKMMTPPTPRQRTVKPA
jgi:hypothetical protein